jgi:hypothetical protein
MSPFIKIPLIVLDPGRVCLVIEREATVDLFRVELDRRESDEPAS